MRKLILTKLLFAILSIHCICAYGQSVIVIKSGEIEPYEQALNGFKSEYSGRITEFIVPKSPGDKKDILDNIEAESPESILAIGIDALLFAKEKISSIPIVYCMVMDPEKYGITNSKNITGITLKISTKDQMLKLKSIIPELKKVGIIYNPKNTKYIVKEALQIGKILGIDFVTEKVRSQKTVPKALRKLNGEIDALWLIADATVITRDSFSFIILYTLENNIPLMAYCEAFVQAGALMSLSENYLEIGKQAAKIVKDVGNKKTNLLGRIIEPENSYFIINTKTSKTIGIKIPREVIESADKVFD